MTRGELVLLTEGGEERETEEFGGGNADADTFCRQFRIESCEEGDLGKGAVGKKASIVAVVPEVIEGFVGIFDGDFGAGGRGKEGCCHGIEEVGAVGVVLVGGDDQELGDAGSGGECRGGDGSQRRKSEV